MPARANMVDCKNCFPFQTWRYLRALIWWQVAKIYECQLVGPGLVTFSLAFAHYHFLHSISDFTRFNLFSILQRKWRWEGTPLFTLLIFSTSFYASASSVFTHSLSFLFATDLQLGAPEVSPERGQLRVFSQKRFKILSTSRIPVTFLSECSAFFVI